MTIGNPVQVGFRRHQQPGWPGGLARPNEPHAFDVGRIYVPNGGTAPQPGDGVYFDEARGRWALPIDDATLVQVAGILSNERATLQAAQSSPGPLENSDVAVEFADNDRVKVGVFGTFYVLAGAALDYGSRLEWDRSDQRWDVRDAAAAAVANATGSVNLALLNNTKDAIVAAVNDALAALTAVPIVCVSEVAVAADNIAMARIGYGRVY